MSVEDRVPAHLREELAALDAMARAVEEVVIELRDRILALVDEWNTTDHPSLGVPGDPDEYDHDLAHESGLSELELRLYAIGLRACSTLQGYPDAGALQRYGFSGPGIDDYTPPRLEAMHWIDELERQGALMRIDVLAGEENP